MQTYQQTSSTAVGAIVLAAGLSTRMGKPKMILPWGSQTVIKKIVTTLLSAGVTDVVVVTGGLKREIEATLNGQPVQIVFNPNYDDGIMVNSLKVGLKALKPSLSSTLIALGDNPQIEQRIVEKIIEEYRNTGSTIIVPSYQMRRGHPWLVDKSHWQTLTHWAQNRTLHDFLNQYSQDIHYVTVDTPSIVMDLDTLDDYESQKPDAKLK